MASAKNRALVELDVARLAIGRASGYLHGAPNFRSLLRGLRDEIIDQPVPGDGDRPLTLQECIDERTRILKAVDRLIAEEGDG